VAAEAVSVWRSRPCLVSAVVVGSCVGTAMVWRFGWSLSLPPYLCFGAASVAASVTDLTDRRIPNRIVAPAYLAVGPLLALASTAGDRW